MENTVSQDLVMSSTRLTINDSEKLVTMESWDEQEDVIKVRTNLYSNSQKENTWSRYNALPIF